MLRTPFRQIAHFIVDRYYEPTEVGGLDENICYMCRAPIRDQRNAFTRPIGEEMRRVHEGCWMGD